MLLNHVRCAVVGVAEQRDGGGRGSQAVMDPAVRCGYCLRAACCSVFLTPFPGVCIGAYCRTDHEKRVKWVYEWKFPYFRLFSFFPPDFPSRCFGGSRWQGSEEEMHVSVAGEGLG